MITTAIPKLPFIDKHATLDFYIGQLGCHLLADYGDYLLITLDQAEVHFFSYPALVPAKSDFMIYLRVEHDIDGLYERYKNAVPAAALRGAMETKPWRQREFALVDPNGTLLTFGQAV
jgi:catechol 2,3-dioxygenase-like lactoylglutathione lyase family enzyme